jgi:hypothetical protein
MGLCKEKKIVFLSFVSVLAFFWHGDLGPYGLWINGYHIMAWGYGDTNYDAYVTRRYIDE